MDLGSVVQICRYPVKSMAGQELEEAYVSPAGIVGDRLYALGASQFKKGRFTARQLPQLLLARPEMDDDPSLPYASGFVPPVRVDLGAIGENTFDILNPALLSHFESLYERISGKRIALSLLSTGEGIYDQHAISLLGGASLSSLSARMGEDIDPRRFRENLYIAWETDVAESDLVGSRLQVGDARFLVREETPRCMMTTLHPDTAVPNPRIHRIIAQENRNMFGLYASVEAPGNVRKGDRITLLG